MLLTVANVAKDVLRLYVQRNHARKRSKCQDASDGVQRRSNQRDEVVALKDGGYEQQGTCQVKAERWD